MTQAIESLERATPERMQYWGGFFDETLYLDIDHHVDRHPRSTDPTLEDNIIYDPHISINSSRRSILDSLVPVLPGRLVPDYSNPEEKNHEMWSLRARQQLSAFRFLQLIIPYLSYKRAQADILVGFLRQKREVRRELEGLCRVPRYPSPADRIAVEEDFRKQLIAVKTIVFNDPHMPTQPARLAGIVDASSVFSIYSTKRAARPNPEFQAHCSLTSVHRGFLEGLYQTYGGAEPVKEGERVGRYAGPSYLWQIDGQRMLPLLKRVEPFLIFKQTEARLVIDFLTLRPLLTRTSPDPFINAQRTRIQQSFTNQWQVLGRR